MKSANPATLNRIRSLAIRNVRGFPWIDSSPTTINTNGDIVLLAGANGMGKSSLLEAIALLCTGGTWEDDANWRQIKTQPSTIEAGINSGSAKISIAHHANSGWETTPLWWHEADTARRHARVVVCDPVYVRELLRGEGDKASTGSDFVDFLAPNPPEADALREAFSQFKLRLDSAFKRFAARRNPADIENTSAKRKALITHAADSARSWAGHDIAAELGAALRDFDSTGDPAPRLHALAELAARHSSGLSTAPAFPGSESLKATSGQLLRFIADCLSAIETDLLHNTQHSASATEVAETLAALTHPELLGISEKELGNLRANTEAQLAEITQRLDALRKLRSLLTEPAPDKEPLPAPTIFLQGMMRFTIQQSLVPKLAEQAGIDTEEHQDLFNGFANLGTLAVDVQQWLLAFLAQCEEAEKECAHKESRARQKFTEMERAPALVKALDQLLGPSWSKLIGEQSDTAPLLKALQRRQARRKSKTGSASAVREALAAWADFEDRIALQRPLSQQEELEAGQLETMIALLQKQAGSSAASLIGNAQKHAAASQLLPMENFLNEMGLTFRLSSGVLPVSLGFSSARGRRLFELQVGKDSRSVRALSTGQKNQLGLLLFLALGYATAAQFRTRVICFDDVMSSFDMNQLPRLAVMLRQLAYGDHDGRRQIFIASHDEEVSRRLALMLAPPKGRLMRVLRFQNFDPEKGPKIVSHECGTRDLPEATNLTEIVREGMRGF